MTYSGEFDVNTIAEMEEDERVEVQEMKDGSFDDETETYLIRFEIKEQNNG